MLNYYDVYAKFGETSEAAQLLETELGTLLFFSNAISENLIEIPNPDRAFEIYSSINRKTFGQLLHAFKKSSDEIDKIYSILNDARDLRNHLAHSFFLHHNIRLHSHEGRLIMIKCLDGIHEEIFDAYMLVCDITNKEFEKHSIKIKVPEITHLPLST